MTMIGVRMNRKRVTLADIAKDTGLSAITVSRAFSSPLKVRPETLDIIEESSTRLGYSPNRAARALKTNRTKTIGIVNPNMSNPFFGEITKAMVTQCQKLDYDVLMFDSYELEDYENKAIRNLIEYSVDGIIISTISMDKNYHPTYVKKLNENEIPFILLDRELEGDYNGVYIDNMDSGYQLGKMIANAYDIKSKIKIIAASDISMVSNNRIAGFRAALFQHNISIHNTDFSMDLSYKETLKILESEPDTKVLVGLNNQITLGIIKAVIELGLKPQVDLKIYSVDHVPYSEIFGIKIPCITHNLEEMAFQAVNSIMRLINGEKITQNKVIIRGQLYSL